MRTNLPADPPALIEVAQATTQAPFTPPIPARKPTAADAAEAAAAPAAPVAEQVAGPAPIAPPPPLPRPTIPAQPGDEAATAAAEPAAADGQTAQTPAAPAPLTVEPPEPPPILTEQPAEPQPDPEQPAAEVAQTSPDAPPEAPAEAVASLPEGGFTISFEPEAETFNEAGGRLLAGIAQRLMDNEAIRLEVRAYAGGTPEAASQARRLSLDRALAVREFLIDRGVRSTRIDVRALGNTATEGSRDRVDLQLMD